MPIILPRKCLRKRKDCKPLAQIQSDCKRSFICCGENDGNDRVHKQDRLTVCWKNETIDERSHWDERDIADTMSVFAQALSVLFNRDAWMVVKNDR